jgi:hypothetical protein
MNVAGHSTCCRPEHGEPARDFCLPGASNPELAEFLGVAPRPVDNSIASLGCTAPGNTIRGVLLFSRPFIPVRKNYLTRRAGAWRVPQGPRGRSRLVVQGIRGQRPGSSRRLRDRRTGRHLPTDPMTARLAERLFFGASFQDPTFCCGRGGVATQDVVGHEALLPAAVLGYSTTLFLAPSVPLLARNCPYFPCLTFGVHSRLTRQKGSGKCGNLRRPRTKYRSAVRQLKKAGGCRG